MNLNDQPFVREAIALAMAARNLGEYPFGAVLVLDGQVVHQAHDRCISLNDPTAHAELLILSEYCRKHQAINLNGLTLYSSTEPCVMCAGAIKWARVSRVVFSVSQAMLQELSGGKPKPSCASIINTGGRTVEIVGPLLPEEGLKVLEGFDFKAKRNRL